MRTMVPMMMRRQVPAAVTMVWGVVMKRYKSMIATRVAAIVATMTLMGAVLLVIAMAR